jgi:predicted ATPase
MAASRRPAFRRRAGGREVLDGLLDGVRGGRSAGLVVRGEAGVGKTALLRYCARQASGFRVARIAGVESEMELPFAALHQLCASLLGRIGSLPVPQQDALGVASGAPPDRFLVALATLSLLAEVGGTRPLLCLVDDGQWLDGASAQVLGFVARRLHAESVLILVALREPAGEAQFAGVPDLVLDGLAEPDARALLTGAVPARLDDDVRDRIVAETRGNPSRCWSCRGA